MLDYIVIAGYLLAIFGIAIFTGSSKESDQASNRFLAGRKLNFFEVCCSIVATETSALTFLGLTAVSFASDLSLVLFYLGALLSRILQIKYYLPKVYGSGITLYEIVASGEESINSQRSISSIYFISKILGVGVKLFSGSIILAHFFQIDIIYAIILVAALTSTYSIFGGLKVIVRTDILQLFILVLAGIVSHNIIASLADSSWSTMMIQAYSASKMTVWNSSNHMASILSILGGFIYACALGIDQDYAQRILGAKDLKTAQLGVITGTIISLLVALLFLTIGTLLWSYYQQTPAPEGVLADKLFANFIIQHFPAGLKGLVIAGIIAATMSTLDSAVNALSACLSNDIFPARNQQKIRSYQFLDTTLILLAIVLIGCIASNSKEMLILGMKLPAYSLGGLIAIVIVKLFCCKFLKIRFTMPVILSTAILSALVVFLVSYSYSTSWYIDYLVGALFSTLFLFAVSRFQKDDSTSCI